MNLKMLKAAYYNLENEIDELKNMLNSNEFLEREQYYIIKQEIYNLELERDAILKRIME